MFQALAREDEVILKHLKHAVLIGPVIYAKHTIGALEVYWIFIKYKKLAKSDLYDILIALGLHEVLGYRWQIIVFFP